MKKNKKKYLTEIEKKWLTVQQRLNSIDDEFEKEIIKIDYKKWKEEFIKTEKQKKKKNVIKARIARYSRADVEIFDDTKKFIKRNNCHYLRLVKFAEEMRNKPTKCEKLFKRMLDENNINYENQKIIMTNRQNEMIIDFVVDKIAIEIDGGYHNNSKQKLIDKKKDVILKKLGYKVIRFSNDEVLNNSDNVRDFFKK